MSTDDTHTDAPWDGRITVQELWAALERAQASMPALRRVAERTAALPVDVATRLGELVAGVEHAHAAVGDARPMAITYERLARSGRGGPVEHGLTTSVTGDWHCAVREPRGDAPLDGGRTEDRAPLTRLAGLAQLRDLLENLTDPSSSPLFEMWLAVHERRVAAPDLRGTARTAHDATALLGAVANAASAARAAVIEHLPELPDVPQVSSDRAPEMTARDRLPSALRVLGVALGEVTCALQPVVDRTAAGDLGDGDRAACLWAATASVSNTAEAVGRGSSAALEALGCLEADEDEHQHDAAEDPLGVDASAEERIEHAYETLHRLTVEDLRVCVHAIDELADDRNAVAITLVALLGEIVRGVTQARASASHALTAVTTVRRAD